MLHIEGATTSEPLKRLTVSLARHADDVRKAQCLRWRVFVNEFGAVLHSPEHGLDIDRFDDHCEHLVVHDRITERVVGTYRLLTESSARRAGGYYSEQEFDITSLRTSRSKILEMGRSCVDPNYRGGAIMAMLWSGLSGFLLSTPHDTLIGCASISAYDGGHQAASVYASLAKTHRCAPEHRVVPHHPLELDGLDTLRDATPPPLIKGYLRSGAVVCGAPAYDREFNTADLFMMLPLERLEERHARHFRQPIPDAAA